ncbi:transposase, partial [Pseudomonas viridiflava]|uniref:transposase n=1 Tax=Pseudomonas viridiflava TaxID=33069 RepID=UPI001F1383FD
MTYVFDKGYCSYNWWYQIHQAEAFFVTRLKKDANIQLSHEHSCPSPESRVQADEIVEFGKRHRVFRDTPVRRVKVQLETWENPLTLVTNDLTRSAEEIADLY